MNKIMMICIILFSAILPGCIEDTKDENIEITIVTYDVSGLSDSMLSDFQNNTGYRVNLVKLDDAGSILDHILQSKGSQTADLALGLDNTYLQIALDSGVLIDHAAKLYNIEQSSLEFYNGSKAVPFDKGWICLNYDAEFVDGENLTIPTSLWNLTGDDWKGKVAIPSPMTSSPGRAFMVATTDYFDNDEDNTTDWTDWWSAMNDNDIIITSGWSEAYETHYTGGYGEWTDGYIGDANIALSYCHSPGVEAHYGEGWTKSAALDIDRSSFLQIEYISVLEGANVEAASAFIEYLVSGEINQNMPTENFMYSVLENNDLPIENEYRANSLIPQVCAEVSSQNIAANMEDWLTMWNAALSQG